jgi:hypothetical protein
LGGVEGNADDLAASQAPESSEEAQEPQASS